jgi:hypothetical protein
MANTRRENLKKIRGYACRHKRRDREFGGTWDEKMQKYVWKRDMTRIQFEVGIKDNIIKTARQKENGQPGV